jgi:DNA-binding transcriptional regulator PaaX
VRRQLLCWLRQNDFGFLQNSVWIRPDPITRIKDTLKDFRDNVKCLIPLEARAGDRASCLAIVRGAWDFGEINHRYQTYLDWVSKKTRRDLNWFRQERLNWLHATSLDPFLPQKMLPPDYLGISAWRARQKILVAPSKLLSE